MVNVRKISKKYCLKQIATYFLMSCFLFYPSTVLATPNGASVVAGSAGVGQSSNTTTVMMGSTRAVINWGSLNTSSSEILQFLKAGGSFAVLNRVVQGGATQFDGSLFGNQGHIIMVNPRGIVFGPTALVQAYKFTASGLDISNPDFMNGHYQFVGGDGIGAVSNYGEISAEQVALIGKQVLNAGVIRSPGGYVLMAAGDRVFLGQDGSNVVVEIDAVKVQGPADPAVTGMGDVINEGTVEAAGGKIILAAGDTFSRAIEGLDTLTVAVESGTGRVGQFGTLSADAVEGDGGSITLTAGDAVALSLDSLTTANAGVNGDGGEVIVYSPDTALFWPDAKIEAKGGSESGAGGFVEVSGRKHVEIYGMVNTKAVNGENGMFLIDPTNVTITGTDASGAWSGGTTGTWTPNASGSVANVDTALQTGDVTVTTNNSLFPAPEEDGDITIAGAVTASAQSYSLTLQAADDIILSAGIDMSLGTGNLTLTADWDSSNVGAIVDGGGVITMNAAGDLLMTAGSGIGTSTDFIETIGLTDVAATTNTGGIFISNSISGNINVTTLGPTVGLTTTTSGDISVINTAGNIVVDSPVDAGSGDVTLNSAGSILSSAAPDGVAELTAADLVLDAVTGIGAGAGGEVETDAATVNASISGTGDIDILEKGAIELTDVDTFAGDIRITAGGQLTAISVEAGTPGGAGNGDVTLTTSSGDVIVTDVKALDDQITIDSAGSILSSAAPDGVADLTANELDLDAVSGISGLSPIETAASLIAADTTAGNIEIDNDNTLATTATSLTTGVGNIDFYQHGGGDLQVDLATTTSGDIDVEVDDGGNLTAISVEAGTAGGAGNGDVSLTTTAGGDIKLGSVTALDDEIDVDSAGSINDNTDDDIVDVTGGDLILTARDEIGGNPEAGKTTDTLGAIETDVTTLEAHSNTSGDIVIVETDDVGLHDVVSESGSIFLEATDGGMTYIDGRIEAGSSTLTLVQADDLDLAGFVFGNQANTDLMVKITDGGLTADDANPENAADQWQSIQAKAVDNIVLQGSDAVEDIKIGTHEGFNPDPLLDLVFGGVVKSTEGGVSIISENGAVRTAGDSILDNVEIAGASDHLAGTGVDLPYEEGKAAIIIMSAKDLMLGPGTTLTANGTYGGMDIDGIPIDDRSGVGFIDVPVEIPIDYPRNQGDPFDVAIYLASTGDVTGEGNVEVDSKVSIMSGFGPMLPGFERKGAMVIDAYDSVMFGDLFEESLAGDDVDSDVGDRLEVSSRMTEWLFEAFNNERLPYVYEDVPFPPFLDGYTYVLRGAGLDNPGITDGRAWVLEDPTEWAPFEETEVPTEETAFAEGGCPVLMEWLAGELGIPEETIQVYLAYAFVYSTDVQPCEACERLLAAATVLEDAEGARIAAMIQVFNELAPADAAFTPATAASVVTAFAGHVNDGTYYATAIEYIDAFVQYVAILNTEMGSPLDDSIAFVMEKHGAGITESDNANIGAFVATRLEGLETFGD